MKYNIKTDLWIRILLWALMLMFVPMFFFVEADELYILALSTILMVIIIIPLFNAYYELADEDVVIHIYGFKKRIKYDNIKSIRMCQNWFSSSAMSKDRIEIIEHHKKKILGTTYISPINREDFFTDLKHRCRNLDIVQEEHDLETW